MQEEERERRMDYIPDESAINVESIEVSSMPSECRTLAWETGQSCHQTVHCQGGVERVFPLMAWLSVHVATR